jgi:LysR family transcriptional regulator, benzoate and cis,cis-muconate-responsive activator of ben and cat genes
MELRHLRTFVAVAEEGRLGAAAARLYLSPPTVTEHVQALERQAGTRLLVRGRRAELTAAGEKLVAYARQALTLAEEALADVRGDEGVLQARLRVGVASNGAGRMMRWIIREFMTSRPGAELTITRLDFTDHLAAVLEHRVDVAFVRPAPADDRIRVCGLYPEPRVIMVPVRHRLAGASEGVSVEEVLDEKFIGLSEATVGSFEEYAYLRSARNGMAPRRGAGACRDVSDVLAAVAVGRGVAAAVESFRGYGSWPGVAYVPLLGVPPAVNTIISLRRDRSPLVADFLGTARAVMAVTTAGVPQ